MKKIQEKAIQTTYFSIAVNLILAIIKGITGVLGNSYALIADAIESTADIFSSVLLLFGLKYATKPADANHPYGHGKAEPLITFGIVGFLLISAVVIAYQAIDNILTPHEVPELFTLPVLIIVILLKEAFYRFIKKKGKETKSSSLKADAWHHRADAITSFTALLGIIVALVLGKGYEAADDWAALIASAVIVFNAYIIFRPALGEIMDEHLYDELIEDIRDCSLEVKGVLDTEKCFVRKTGMTFHVDLHVIVDGSISVEEGHKIAHDLKDHLQKEIPELADILIHIEPAEMNNKSSS